MIIRSDSRHIPLSNGFVNCIITSPPYWSLRKYDIPNLIWDGEGVECEHEWGNKIPPRGKSNWDSFDDYRDLTVDYRHGGKMSKMDGNTDSHGSFCLRCSAWRGQLGLEPTIDLYLKHLLQIMDECKRVLRDDGTMWVNLGDSYSGSWGNRSHLPETKHLNRFEVIPSDFTPGTAKCGLPPKSLCLIPERFSIEMVNRGWILRNKIVWHKLNCMPASTKDRFTVDFEPVFFFVKSKKYWFETQYEPHVNPEFIDADKYGTLSEHNKFSSKEGNRSVEFGTEWSPKKRAYNPQGHNKRCVWTIPTQPYSEAHFATFPEALVEPMIRAGCPIGGIVLDPFCGSGTVIKVAEKLQRKAIGIDLGYQELAEKRREWNQVELLI